MPDLTCGNRGRGQVPPLYRSNRLQFRGYSKVTYLSQRKRLTRARVALSARCCSMSEHDRMLGAQPRLCSMRPCIYSKGKSYDYNFRLSTRSAMDSMLMGGGGGGGGGSGGYGGGSSFECKASFFLLQYYTRLHIFHYTVLHKFTTNICQKVFSKYNHSFSTSFSPRYRKLGNFFSYYFLESARVYRDLHTPHDSRMHAS